MYSETTRSIKVTVKPVYLEDQSSPTENHYVWAYHVRIENQGGETVQLRRRHWRITDALGRVKRCAAPASSASSRCSPRARHLRIHQRHRPSARRRASWSAATRWRRREGESFAVAVPAFSLDSPHQSVRLN